GNANIGGVNVASGASGNTGATGDTSATGVASSIANSGAASRATSASGNTGDAANAVRATLIGGRGGAGGDNARVSSGRAGDARARQSIQGRNNRVSLGAVTGGDSIADGSVNGGAGGDVHSDQSPSA